MKGDWLLQFDGQKAKALYRFRTDLLIKDNCLGKHPDVAKAMERELKAIIQQYMTRMTENELVVKGVKMR